MRQLGGKPERWGLKLLVLGFQLKMGTRCDYPYMSIDLDRPMGPGHKDPHTMKQRSPDRITLAAAECAVANALPNMAPLPPRRRGQAL